MGPGYRHVACCVDDSPQAETVIDEALRLVADDDGATLSLVHSVGLPTAVLALPIPDMSEVMSSARTWLDEQGKATAQRVADAGAHTHVEIVLLEGHAGVAVTEWAAEADVDLIVAAAHRGYIDRALLGSFAGYVVYHAPCAIHLVRPRRAADTAAAKS